jgi:hypothetical protein
VDAQGEKPKPVTDPHWGDFKAAARLWKKSNIPFAPGQTHEIVIRYHSAYAATESSVSDDGHSSEAYFRYSLSPAATWKGPIGKGKITVNYLHPRPEEISVSKPKNRFKKINATQFEWEFQNLKPTLADDLKIVVHPAYDTYAALEFTPETYEHPPQYRAEYIVESKRYFIQHSDYEAVASSTLPAKGEEKYDVVNLKGLETNRTWAEGAEGDGVGESISLKVNRPLPLDAILIMPGYRAQDDEKTDFWGNNNRVAELEVTLNNEHTFTAAIPDHKFGAPYPIPVRDYSKLVDTMKLTIKAVHRGTATRDTCISLLELRGKLTQKPKLHPSR